MRHGGLQPCRPHLRFRRGDGQRHRGRGLPGILSIQPQYWAIYSLAMLVAIVVPVVLTLLVYKRQQVSKLAQASA